MSVIDVAFGRHHQASRRSAEGSIHDRITGLVGSQAFQELASERLCRCAATAGRCALLVISGRSGDGATLPERYMKLVADAIRASIRPPDLAGHTEGGDFAVLLDRCDREDAKQVCGRIVRAVYAATAGTRQEIPAVGIAVAPGQGTALEELLRYARKELRSPRASALVVSAATA